MHTQGGFFSLSWWWFFMWEKRLIFVKLLPCFRYSYDVRGFPMDISTCSVWSEGEMKIIAGKINVMKQCWHVFALTSSYPPRSKKSCRKKKIQTNWHGNKSTRKTFINDDWRLRNDLPYKAVKQHTEPTRIKLQNHLSKLNVAHTKIFLRHEGGSGRSKGTFFDNQSLIFITSFVDARNWWVNRSLQSCSMGKSMFKQVWLFSTSWLSLGLSTFPFWGRLSRGTRCPPFDYSFIAVCRCFQACNNENNSPRINSL